MNTQYVARLLMELQQEFQGLHQRMENIESIRYLEDKIALSPEEKTSGLEVRIGAVAELIENVKAALTSNVPQVVIKPLRSGPEATDNSDKRERFWKSYLRWMCNPIPVLNELADGQASPGIGILKGVFYPWPESDRRRLKSEPRTKKGDADYKDRQRALKRQWGPPFRTVTVHPLSFYFRLGDNNQIVEAIEHSYKPKRVMYGNYGEPGADKPVTGDSQLHVAATSGQPDESIRPLPIGADTSTMVLVTEYWRDRIGSTPGLYQIYVGSEKVFEQADPSVRYFLAMGRTTSSKDTDKMGMSVAELLSHNEPTINRTLTRIAEAAEITVHKRLTVELPEGEEDTESVDSAVVPRTWRFKADVAEALPAGAKVHDPFMGVENAFQALPFVQFLLEIQGLHGVSPIFKGIPPGAAGSGYRDNSIYMMALSQFQYLLDSYANCITEYIRWMEQQITKRARQEVFVDDLSLTPSDIRDFPAIIEINITPLLPQNIIAMGQFYDRMHTQGHITRRMVIEKGLREEQPGQILWDLLLESCQEQLIPGLIKDVIDTVNPPPLPPPQLLGPDGKPASTGGGAGGGPGGVQAMMAEMAKRGDGQGGKISGGQTRAGQPRQPPEEAGAAPPGLTEGSEGV